MKYFAKFIALLLLTLLSCQGISNETVQNKIIWKNFPMGKNFVMVSDEYQIWMLHGLEPNKQTWGEWIRGEEIPQIEDRYIFKKDQWEPGVEISIIYSPWDECDWK
ncbi:MAG: hypothetical protein KDK76_04335, partial [Chlamydiia bacterium]|nr:hypothetical protein [Chlamydiia bacterium]